MPVVEGWLAGVDRIESPNADDRPAGCSVDLVVIHNISLPPGRYGGGFVKALFTNHLDPTADPYFGQIAQVRVSAHVVIERDGRITQFVPFERRAWHAGVSVFEGRPRCNDFSVGIELEGSDFEPFSDPQYLALNGVLAMLCRSYPVRAVRGHSDIAPGRKTDPGPFFDWQRLELPAHVSSPRSRT